MAQLTPVEAVTLGLLDLIENDVPQIELDQQIDLIHLAIEQTPEEERPAAIAAIHNRITKTRHASVICSMLDIPQLERDGDETSELLDSVIVELLDSIDDMNGLGRDDAIAALMSNVALTDGFQFERLRTAVLKKKLMRAKTFDDEIAKRRFDLEHQDAEGKAQEERPVTWPYRIENGRIVYLFYRSGPDGTKLESMPVADFTATIKEEVTDEDGRKTFVIKGKAIRGGGFEFEMDANDFGSEMKLKAVLDAASGARDPVRAGMKKHLSAALQLLTDNDMTKTKRYMRTGWADDKFLIPGREPPGVAIHLEKQMPFRIDPDANLELGLEALRCLLVAIKPELTTVITSFIFQAPLGRLTAWDNERYAIFSSGRTGSFKTEFAKCILSIYGPGFTDRHLLIKWGAGATANSIMHLAVRMHDMPILIDNFKPNTGDGVRGFVSLTHNIMEGGEKLRLKRSTDGLRTTRPAFCWPYYTGEDVPDTDAASLARVLIVPFPWQDGEPNENLKVAQKQSHHLCAVGGAWIEWLETKDAQDAIAEINSLDEFEKRREKWSKKLQEAKDDIVNVWRVATNLATNELTWETLMLHPSIGPIAKDFQEYHQAGLEQVVAKEMAEATAEALEGARYLSVLRELLVTNRAILKRRDTHVNPMTDDERARYERNKDRVLGWKDDEGIYLLPTVTRDAIERIVGDSLNHLSNAAIYKQLNSMGVLIRGKKATKTLQMEGETQRVLHLSPDALDFATKEGDEDKIPF